MGTFITAFVRAWIGSEEYHSEVFRAAAHSTDRGGIHGSNGRKQATERVSERSLLGKVRGLAADD